ncbi:hypothetical protein [Aliamphritea hakodatensis]|uniref:hypothetical protein n=1 Tax=Aliamphritea hakodatensis TaxID=2895352 RepID=UPI0022FD8E79|nr:hypothetical protein [Aliamphritea hakodatensis]
MDPLFSSQQPASELTHKQLMALSAFIGGLAMLSFSLNRRGAHTVFHSTGNTVYLQILKPVQEDEPPLDMAGDLAKQDGIRRREGDSYQSAVYFEGELNITATYTQAQAMLHGWNEYLLDVERSLKAYRCR